MKKNMMILVVWVFGLEQFELFGVDLCDGVYFGVQYWYDVDMFVNYDLVKCMQVVFKFNLNYSFVGFYICIKILFDVMIKVGSVDLKVVIVVLQGMKYDGLMGFEEICVVDYQVFKNYYLFKGKFKNCMKDKDDFVEVVLVGKVFLLVEQMQCKLV